jgi:malonate-semialdehyde dehydrogenase (acetylating) / methylmalonate-semialdehyde dehydrogenase
MRTISHWIGGKSWEQSPERSGKVFNPATGEQSGEVAFATVAEVDAAVETARKAFEEWRHVPVTRRQNVMFDFRRIVADRKQQMAELLTAEHGKTIPDALGEVQRGLEVIEFACNIAHLTKGEYSEQVSTGVDTYTIRQPLGGGGYHPVQLPGHGPDVDVPARHRRRQHLRPQAVGEGPVGVAAGGGVVGRGRAAPGCVQRGPRRQGGRRPHPHHPDIAAVSFVGSTPIAKYIYETGTSHGKRVQALGGPRTTWWCCPTPTWNWPPTPPSRPGSARPGSGAWPSRW